MIDRAGPPRRWALVVSALLLLAGCRPQEAAPTGLPVVATIYPLAEFARRISGGAANVHTLIPPGVEAHDYEPTPQDLVVLSRARLFIYNGAGFEPWAERLIGQLPQGSAWVDATEGLPLARGDGGVDPHVWLDPVLAQQQALRIARALVRVDPDNRTRYESATTALLADLGELDGTYRQVLSGCRGKEFITAHAAFGYLARRYGLRMIAVSGLAPEAEPSASRLKEIVQQARRAAIRVVYVEPLGEQRVAETIAREIGGVIAVLDPLENQTVEAQRVGKNYFTVMHENLDHLAQGLDCR